jgi:hypothetical protein
MQDLQPPPKLDADNQPTFATPPHGSFERKLIGTIAICCGVLAHYLACAESPLFWRAVPSRIEPWTSAFAYSIPGTFLSLLLVKVVDFVAGDTRWYTYIPIAIWLGLLIRISSYFWM